MKKIILGLISLFCLLFGVVAGSDVTMVLLGYKGQFNSYPQYGLEWWDSPILGYNISTSANLIMGLMALMALVCLYFYGKMFLQSVREYRRIRAMKGWREITVIGLFLILLSSCAAMPRTKKDCEGNKHYRQSNGVYVKCDFGHTHVDSTFRFQSKIKHSLTH